MSLGAGRAAALRQYGWVYSIVPGKAFEKAFEKRRDMVMSSNTDAGSSNINGKKIILVTWSGSEKNKQNGYKRTLMICPFRFPIN
jgi:hypothetical protein